jgi:hypothetical protein
MPKHVDPNEKSAKSVFVDGQWVVSFHSPTPITKRDLLKLHRALDVAYRYYNLGLKHEYRKAMRRIEVVPAETTVVTEEQKNA